MAAAVLTIALAALAVGCSSDRDASTDTTAGTAAATTTVVAGPTTTAAGTRVPEGFTSVIVRLTKPDGTTVEWCVYLASTGEEHGRGLMEVDSLGDRPGMLFDFHGPTEAQFYMLKTRIPLAVGFFGEDGQLVSRADMVPCPDDDNDPPCPLYPASGPYRYALEMPPGELEQDWLVPGTKLESTGATC